MPRLNIADRYGSPRYTSIGQTQSDGATAAARKMTRSIDDSSRRQWGEPPRRMTEWDYGPGGRPWGAPANSWIFEQGRKVIQDRHGSDQAISDWLARTEDDTRSTSRAGWGKAPESLNGWIDAGRDASTSLKKNGWNEMSEASSRFGYHPLSLPSDDEDQSNGWDGNPERTRARAQKGRSGWQTDSGCREKHGWGEESDCVKDSGWVMEPARKVARNGWKESGCDASTGIGEQWHGSQGLSNSSDVPVSEHFDHEDQSDVWGYRPKRSHTEAQKGRSGWGDDLELGEDSGWAGDGWVASVKAQGNGSGSDDWGNDTASPTGMKWPEYSPSFGEVLTPSESTEPSFKGPKTRQAVLTQQHDEEVQELRRQLVDEKRKNAELGRRLYTLENEQIDPGNVYGIAQGDEDTQTAAFEWSAEKPMPSSTPLTPVFKPKPARKVAAKSVETEHFNPLPKRLPKTTLDSIASSVPPGSYPFGGEGTLNRLKWDANTHYDRYSGVIRDKIHGTRPVFFTMDQTATFGDVLRSWKKRRGIQDDYLILYSESDRWVMSLENTVSMEGIMAQHIELDVTTWDKHWGR